MDATTLRETLARLGLTQGQAGRDLFGVAERTVRGWCADRPIPETAARLVMLAERFPEVREALREGVGDGDADID